ncbi:Arc family DNA-binding protein [Rhizobium binxianense]|uniref:Arc family DNA-binding protein n=1 Tax=Rhizobium binxianense TaxID=3024242 RepID=UPI00234F2105|nr:Arc family DNA-binding protein [Rhizobium sp. BC56]MDC7745005.1 Arc family DNA-binding protein [Rhizobium sp. BC56]
MNRGLKKIMLRLPHEAKSFVEAEAKRNHSSQNSEIIRCIVERMEKLQAAKLPALAQK